MNQRMEDLADRIDAIAEDLDELAFDLLREAASRKEARPAADRSILQARRALQKASHALRSSGGAAVDDD